MYPKFVKILWLDKLKIKIGEQRKKALDYGDEAAAMKASN